MFRAFAVAALFCALVAPTFAEEKTGVTLTLGVEMRGVLSVGEKTATITVKVFPRGRAAAHVDEVWTLDLERSKELQKQAKALDGKTVVVSGRCRLLGIKSETVKHKSGPLIIPADKLPWLIDTRSALDVEHKVRVRRLEEAKE